MRYRFGDFQLDAAQHELRRGEERIDIQPLVLELLLYLVCHRDRVVTKDELLDSVWADSAVTEGSLSRAISLARRAIGDTDRGSPLIRNHPKLGYRFCAEAHEEASAPPAVAPERSHAPVRSSYASRGSTHIAYQVVGEEGPDVVVVHGWTLSMQSIWEDAEAAAFHRRLAERARLILFDKRGTGLSDRVKSLPGLAQRMEDLSAVLDAVGSERATILGISEGTPMSILYAASHPERITGLGLLGGFARMRRDDEQPFGWTDDQVARLENYIRGRWGEGASLAAAIATRQGDPDLRSWAARGEQIGCSPGAALELWRMNDQIDVRDVLSVLQVPCLILHASDDPVISVEHGRDLANKIPGARYTELESRDHMPWYPPLGEQVLDAVESWMAEHHADREPERLLSTLLFAEQGSDSPLEWSERLIQLVVAFRGRLARTPGHSLVALFDGPARAIRCAVALGEVLRVSGATSRLALHTTEVGLPAGALPEAATPIEVTGRDFDYVSRILEQAEPGEILVSRPLHDLVIGAEIALEARGEVRSDSAKEAWPIFRVAG